MSAAQDPFVGTTLGKFKIEKKLGQGGMGAVYKARDNLGRVVALKLLPAHFAAQPEWVERFHREASRAALLSHPNIVQVHECDTEAGHHYISMQFMEGGSLEGLIKQRGPLPPFEAARLVRDAARGLQRAHEDGVIHRDIKPANILLGAPGEVRLADFGLVKSMKGDDQPLTQTGMVLGTPHYMAPEQCEGLPDIDGRADLYALGIVLYQALSNVLPVKGSTPLQIIRHRTMEDPPPLSEIAPRVPRELAQLVGELLVRDRDRRLATASELVARLDDYLAHAAGGATEAFPASGGAKVTRATPPSAELPVIDIPPAVVPTAKLLRYEAAAAETDVLPDLGGGGRPPAPSGRITPQLAALRPAPPPARQGLSACWILGCGLLFVGFSCLGGIGYAKKLQADQREREREQLRIDRERAPHVTTTEPMDPDEYAERIEEQVQRELELQGITTEAEPWHPPPPPPPPEKGKKKPW